MLRIPATGEILGPFLIHALRHGVAEGVITAIDAKFVRARRQSEGEELAAGTRPAPNPVTQAQAGANECGSYRPRIARTRY
jgi:hypothetical protein